MAEEKVKQIIVDLFNKTPSLNGIDEEQDFFDIGASSLTIVDMQLQVEEALNVQVPTPVLMGNPTIKGWVSAYSEKVN